MTLCLAEFLQSAEYRQLDEIRNILAHRIAGLRTAQYTSTVEVKGTARFEMQTKEQFWTVLGANKQPFDQYLLERHLDGMTLKLISLFDSAVAFLVSRTKAEK